MLARSVAVGALVLAGCYDLPHPVCGFACGTHDRTCPDDYTCSSFDNRCHLDGNEDASCELAPLDPGDDFTPPQLQFWSPSTFDEQVNTVISVQFTEKVFHVDASSFYVTDDATGQGFPGTVMSSNPITWNLAPTLAFSFGGSYTVHLTPAITDASGNRFSGFTFQFGTMSDNPPIIDFNQFIEPQPDAFGVPVDTSVTVTMSKPVTTLSGKFHLLVGSSGPEVPTTIDNVGTAIRATLDPVEQLQPGTFYSCVVDADVTDLTGHQATFQQGWSFTTGSDTVPPEARDTTPKANSVAPVGTTISVLFDEPVSAIAMFVVSSGATTFPGTLGSSNGGRQWTFTPDAPLPAGIGINVTLSNARDASGNVQNFAFTFSTAP